MPECLQAGPGSCPGHCHWLVSPCPTCTDGCLHMVVINSHSQCHEPGRPWNSSSLYLAYMLAWWLVQNMLDVTTLLLCFQAAVCVKIDNMTSHCSEFQVHTSAKHCAKHCPTQATHGVVGFQAVPDKLLTLHSMYRTMPGAAQSCVCSTTSAQWTGKTLDCK